MPQITLWGERALGALADTGIGILSFAASIIIAGLLLVFYEKSAEAGRMFFIRMFGDRGEEFLNISLKTTRNVAIGVLGVAVIQTSLMAVGLIFAQIPLIAVWILVILIMAIAQLPVLIFNIPLVIYLFTTKDTGPATLWAIYFLAMGILDNILKPILMGKGAAVPMPVIFLGAIGGFIGYGFIGLFLGAIILSVFYKLYLAWVSMKL
jgi:predicted PurR-regulated permease PerM